MASDVAEEAGQETASAYDLACQGANALRLAGRFEEAERGYRSVLASYPGHLDAAVALAFMLRESGRLDAAADAMFWSWKARPRKPDDSERTARFLRECDAWQSALTVCNEQLRLTPDHARLLGFAGDFALALGQFEEAAERYRAALDSDPTLAKAWLRLAQTRRFERAKDPDVKRFRAASSNAALSDITRMSVLFAWGKVLDDLDDVKAASVAFEEANRAAKKRSNWSAAAWQATVAARSTAAMLPASETDPGFVPAFVVGLPRSGTTLLATRLQRHADLRNRGELNWTDAFARRLGANGAAVERAAIERIATMYAMQLRRDDAPARVYLDKNPLNFRYLDVIAALFPNARIIHCRRDRREVAFSLWRQQFAHDDLGFAYDFADIAAFAEGHDRLMAHWRQRNILPILDVDYESLVAAPEAELTRVAEFLGLDRPAADADAPTPAGAIATASLWQARQPVHSRSLGRWRRYADLQPLLVSSFPDE
ncbi:MAG: sulfotransferase [Rhodanobacteraceae bacterium]